MKTAAGAGRFWVGIRELLTSGDSPLMCFCARPFPSVMDLQAPIWELSGSARPGESMALRHGRDWIPKWALILAQSGGSQRTNRKNTRAAYFREQS